MPITTQQKNLHLLWRAGFGPAAGDLASLSTTTPRARWDALVKATTKTPAYIDVADNELKSMLMGGSEMMYSKPRKQLSADERRQLQVRSREGLKTLNITWLNQMINSDQQLREKMSLFWHGHFASR